MFTETTTAFMLRMLLVLALTVSTLSLSFAQKRRQQIFRLTNGLTSATIPFELINAMIVVPVMFNERRALNMILDNGTKNPVIFSKSYVRRMKLEYGPMIHFRGVGSERTVHGQVVKGASLHLSGAAADQIGMVVLKRNPLDQLRLGGKVIHGVLGTTLFNSFVVEIDYVLRQLRLHERATFVAAGGYEATAMQVIESKPFIRATVTKGNRHIHSNFMVDTGFNNVLMLLLPDSVDPTAFVKSRRRNVGLGYGGAIFARVGRTDTLRIGSFVLPTPYTMVPDSKRNRLHRVIPSFARQGTIGNAAFVQTSVIFDYPGETFYIRRLCQEVFSSDEVL